MSGIDVGALAEAALGPDEGPGLQEEMERPIPFDEEKIPIKERNWVGDYGDQVIPSGKGFVSDFIYHTRGYMIPTLACIWSSLFLLSSAIKREAWLKWMPTALFPNLYMIIVGPAGRAKKTTAITQVGMPILENFRSYLTDLNLYKMKYIHVAKDMTSTEALIDSMLPERKPGEDFFFLDEEGNTILGPKGKAVAYRKTSETAIVVSELSSFLTSSNYATNTTNLLLDLFDCHTSWDWKTLGRGKKTLRNLCTNFVAGTTVDGLRQSIPQAAKGDGFVSRTIMVYVPSSKRKYDMPRQAIGAPTMEDMARRLAWVAQHSIGEYKLSAEARKEYTNWYDWFYKTMEDNPALEGAISRMDVHLLKVALLIRCSRYEEQGNEIELRDLLDARKLLDATYINLPFLLGQVDPDDLVVTLTKVEMRLRRRPDGILKWDIGSSLKLKTDILHAVLDELSARGQIEFEFEGKRYETSTRRSGERIFWIGDDYDGGDDIEEGGDRAYFNRAGPNGKRKKRGKASGSEPHGPKTPHDERRDKDAGDDGRDAGRDKEEDKGSEENQSGDGSVA